MLKAYGFADIQPGSGPREKMGQMLPFCLAEFAFDELREHATPVLWRTQNQCGLDLASQKGLLPASDLDAISAPRVVMTRLTAASQLEKVERSR